MGNNRQYQSARANHRSRLRCRRRSDGHDRPDEPYHSPVYNADGEVESTTDPLARITGEGYDADGEVTATSDPLGTSFES